MGLILMGRLSTANNCFCLFLHLLRPLWLVDKLLHLFGIELVFGRVIVTASRLLIIYAMEFIVQLFFRIWVWDKRCAVLAATDHQLSKCFQQCLTHLSVVFGVILHNLMTVLFLIAEE